MDLVLLGALTVAILTGVALILLLIEPEVPVRSRVAGGRSDPLDEPAARPTVVHEPADPSVGSGTVVSPGDSPHLGHGVAGFSPGEEPGRAVRGR